MKLSTITPLQEFIMKTLRFDSSLCVLVVNKVPKMYQGKSSLFNINKLSFDNMVTMKILVEVKGKWYLNKGN